MKHTVSLTLALLMGLSLFAATDACPVVPCVNSFHAASGGVLALPVGASYTVDAVGHEAEAAAFKTYLEASDLACVPALVRGPKAVLRFRIGPKALKDKLGEVKQLHYVGAEFLDYVNRKYPAPQDTEFYLSEDGVIYTQIAVPQLRLSPDRRHFSIMNVGAPVSAKARFVRLRYNLGQQKIRTNISEMIIN